MSDLKTGPVEGTALPPSYKKPERKLEEYKGEPPQTDGKIQPEFAITKECGVDDKDPKTQAAFKCSEKLRVIRVKNVRFKRDKTGYSGHLDYSDDDIKQFIYCSIHGPKSLPETW